MNQVQAMASTDPDSDPDSADDDISLLRPRTEDAFEPSVRLTTIAATPTLFARGTPINSTHVRTVVHLAPFRSQCCS